MWSLQNLSNYTYNHQSLIYCTSAHSEYKTQLKCALKNANCLPSSSSSLYFLCQPIILPFWVITQIFLGVWMTFLITTCLYFLITLPDCAHSWLILQVPIMLSVVPYQYVAPRFPVFKRQSLNCPKMVNRTLQPMASGLLTYLSLTVSQL